MGTATLKPILPIGCICKRQSGMEEARGRHTGSWLGQVDVSYRELLVPPLKVEMEGTDAPLRAGLQASILCRATGSKPPAALMLKMDGSAGFSALSPQLLALYMALSANVWSMSHMFGEDPLIQLS
ncbi:hypothetical protein GWK47_050469 [Chionoecetes opilio]|uniref:Ig-like domain-containing protein n=1 Tax=Chionoecetes opilio TaxID=41210 RepID=A0A8J5CR62_CHIOP|nr:hypothetical protein GWK47_050469 [Chionoecetes opilio]